MLNIKFIRENEKMVRAAILNKNEKVDLDNVLNLDQEKRKLQFEYDSNKAVQNKLSKQIPTLKKEKKDVSEIMNNMKELSLKNKNILSELNIVSKKFNYAMLTIPNIPSTDVPIGRDESDNEFKYEWGKKPVFDFVPKDHLELAKINSLLDQQRATKMSSSGFMGYYDKGAMLERALINYMLDFHIQKHGYTEISFPILVNRKAMIGTGQLPKLENDMYRIEQDDLFLVPTAEVSTTNFYAEEILASKDIPVKFVSYSPCFRREAGSYGKETKGLQRLHQFNKVEMVRFVKKEDSYIALDEMKNDAEEILQSLGLHYRVMNLATGDLSFASAKTYDLEVWAPGTNRYLEVSSISNFEDFQARRALIRYRNENDKLEFVHTLNGSGLATPRLVISLLESYQNESGSIDFPGNLKPYLK